MDNTTNKYLYSTNLDLLNELYYYPDTTYHEVGLYLDNTDTPVKFTPYYLNNVTDPWDKYFDFRTWYKYQPNDTYNIAVKKGTHPTWKHSYSFSALSNITIERNNTNITIKAPVVGDVVLSASDFDTKVLPTNCIIAVSGGGGRGARGDWRYGPGGGGGGGACFVVVLNLENTTNIQLTAGAKEKASTLIYSYNNTSYTLIANAGNGGSTNNGGNGGIVSIPNSHPQCWELAKFNGAKGGNPGTFGSSAGGIVYNTTKVLDQKEGETAKRLVGSASSGSAPYGSGGGGSGGASIMYGSGGGPGNPTGTITGSNGKPGTYCCGGGGGIGGKIGWETDGGTGGPGVITIFF